MFDDYLVESQLRPKQRAYLNKGNQVVDMDEWDFFRGFGSMNRHIAQLNLHPERHRMDTADFGTSTREALYFSDYPAPHQGLK
jgi:hypothetical protein